jgi:hypothetical protein
MENQNNEICAYRELTYYRKCSDCLGTPDSEICYISREELKKHLEQFDRLRLADSLTKLL